MNDTNQVV